MIAARGKASFVTSKIASHQSLATRLGISYSPCVFCIVTQPTQKRCCMKVHLRSMKFQMILDEIFVACQRIPSHDMDSRQSSFCGCCPWKVPNLHILDALECFVTTGASSRDLGSIHDSQIKCRRPPSFLRVSRPNNIFVILQPFRR